MPKMAAKKDENETVGECLTKTRCSDKADGQKTDFSSEEEKAHQTHQFRLQLSSSKTKGVVCNKGWATIEELLQTDDDYISDKEEKSNKVLIIQRQNGRAICKHFPCHLIKENELLIASFKARGTQTAGEQGEKTTSDQIRRAAGNDQNIVFHVRTRGGELVRCKVIPCPVLRKHAEEVTVYAFKGETITDALKRDGRFDETVFKSCDLRDLTNNCDYGLHNAVDTFDEKCFRVVKKKNQSRTQETASSMKDVKKNDSQSSQKSYCDEKSDSPQEPTTEKPEQKTTLLGKTTKAKLSLHAIPDTGEILKILREQFTFLYEIMKDREQGHEATEMQKLLSVEYGKNVETCMRVKAAKELMKYSDSVCQIRVNGEAGGSGFLLFDRFIITNGHVIRGIYDQENNQLKETVTAAFNFEDLCMKGQGQPIAVKNQVVAFACSYDESSGHRDFALLEADPVDAQTMPPGLPWHVWLSPKRGGICIIGHPNGGVKKVDPCLIVPFEDRAQAVQVHRNQNTNHMTLITAASLEGNWDEEFAVKTDKNRITYDTCFHHGSSGSPVFDEFCNVIGMHSGGFAYKIPGGKTQSLIEFALPISSIIDDIRRQLEQNGKREVLNLLEKCNANRCQEKEKLRGKSEGNDERSATRGNRVHPSPSQESMEVD